MKSRFLLLAGTIASTAVAQGNFPSGPVPPVPGAVAMPPAPGSDAPRSQRAPKVQYDTRTGFTLAFVDADVRRVVDAVLGTMMGVDYAVDAAVQGNVTLRTTKPVTKDSLIPLLESALRPLDAVIVEAGGRYRVVPIATARERAPVIVAGNSTQSGSPTSSSAGFASEVIRLRYATAKEIARLLEQFLGKDVVGPTDDLYNQVTITGSRDEREAARALVTRFDVDNLSGMNFELFRLETVDAGTIDAELKKVFQPPFDILGSRVRLVPLPRLRSILAIALDRGDIARISPWIKRLDAGASGKRKLYNYVVQNGRARDIARSLERVLGTGLGSSGDTTSTSVSQTTTNSIDNSVQPGTPAATTTTTATSLTAPDAGANYTAGGNSTSGPRVVPSDESNALLIYANGEEYEFIREALDRLDQPVAQVLIEATLAEVSLTNDLRYGVDFSLIQSRGSVVNSATNAGRPASVFPGLSAQIVRGDVTAILNTLQSKTNVRVLSAPKLIVLNNQTASLQVGDQVPIITQQSQSVSAPGAPIVNSIELRDTGVILKVTPRVNSSGLVTLDISQEVSGVSQTTTAGINSPTIQQRRLSSTVSTRSGQMIALGGLIREGQTKTRSGIPGLSQIPVVGGLFGRQGNIGDRTELIILLTPTIIRSPDEVKGIVDALIDGLDAARPLVDRAKARQVGGNVPSR